ncbi:hypothetical protein [Metallibacterium sp.]
MASVAVRLVRLLDGGIPALLQMLTFVGERAWRGLRVCRAQTPRQPPRPPMMESCRDRKIAMRARGRFRGDQAPILSTPL